MPQFVELFLPKATHIININQITKIDLPNPPQDLEVTISLACGAKLAIPYQTYESFLRPVVNDHWCSSSASR